MSLPDEPITIGDGSPLKIMWQDTDTCRDGTRVYKPGGRPVTHVEIDGRLIAFKKGTKLDLWVLYAVGGITFNLYAFTDPQGDNLNILPASDFGAPDFPVFPRAKQTHSVSRRTGNDVDAEITSAEGNSGARHLGWRKRSRSHHTEIVIWCARPNPLKRKKK